MRLQISVENRETVITEVFGYRPLGRCLCTTVNLVQHPKPAVFSQNLPHNWQWWDRLDTCLYSVQIFIPMTDHFNIYFYLYSLILAHVATSQYDSQFQKRLKSYGLCYEKEFRHGNKDKPQGTAKASQAKWFELAVVGRFRNFEQQEIWQDAQKHQEGQINNGVSVCTSTTV